MTVLLAACFLFTKILGVISEIKEFGTKAYDYFKYNTWLRMTFVYYKITYTHYL